MEQENMKSPRRFKMKCFAVNTLIALTFMAVIAFTVFIYNGAIAGKLEKYPGLLLDVFFVFSVLMAFVVYFSNTTRVTVLGLLGIALVGFAIHALTHKQLEGSALLYIGIPLLLAYIFKNVGTAKSATGSILQGMSIVMLLSGPVLQEGFICIVMAAPLFYIVGGIAGVIIDSTRKKKLTKLQASPLLLVIGLMSLEGVHPAMSFNRDHTVRVERIVEATPEAIQKQLSAPLVLGNDVPTYLKLFPFPTVKQQGGIEVGSRTTLNFVYYKHFYFSPKIGDLTYEVTHRDEYSIESTVIHDDSYVDTYMDWKTSKVSWLPVTSSKTKVVWEISYQRKLDPAWYFGTLEYFTTVLMAEALIKYAATPDGARGV